MIGLTVTVERKEYWSRRDFLCFEFPISLWGQLGQLTWNKYTSCPPYVKKNGNAAR
jgi:hypothetical protein